MAPGKKSQHPRKRFYRARAHSNPLSDSQFPVPISPAHIDWSLHFPAFFERASEAEACTSPVGNAEKGVFKDAIPDLTEGNGKKEALEDPSSDLKEEDGKKASFNDPLPDLEGGDGEEAVIKDPLSTSEVGNVQKGQLIVGTNVDHIVMCDEEPKVRFADIGCGFGGLLVKLSTMFPSTLMVGMELRDKVSEYVKERIIALRKEKPGHYENISIIRTNAMKYLQNYFQKGQLQKMFFLFPDPHFKERNHRRRVISVALLAEYAHVMALGGILYTITDVQDLGEWMKSCLDAHPLFEEVSLQEQELDPVVNLLKTATEEGQKVERNSGDTFRSVYRRISPASDGA
eukprot:c18751_g1_i1 orf=314-1345(-)